MEQPAFDNQRLWVQNEKERWASRPREHEPLMTVVHVELVTQAKELDN